LRFRRFHALQPVISVIICDFTLLKDSNGYMNVYEILDEAGKTLFTDLFKVVIIDLKRLPEKDDRTTVAFAIVATPGTEEEKNIFLPGVPLYPATKTPQSRLHGTQAGTA
jgi:hypothetical protein